MFADGERSWFELTATIQHARNEIALRQQKTFQAKVHGEIFALLRVVFFLLLFIRVCSPGGATVAFVNLQSTTADVSGLLGVVQFLYRGAASSSS